MEKTKKITKQEYSIALCSLAFDDKNDFVKLDSLNRLFKISAKELTEYDDQHPDIPGKNLPLSAVRSMVGLAYTAILKKLNRTDPHTIRVFDAAIKHLSEDELMLEWEAIVDGTVSRIVHTMMTFDQQPDTVKQDIVNIFEGLAAPYFRDYKGKVPKEDLEWAHKQIKDYFQNLKQKEPNLLGGKSSPQLGPGRLKLPGR